MVGLTTVTTLLGLLLAASTAYAQINFPGAVNRDSPSVASRGGSLPPSGGAVLPKPADCACDPGEVCDTFRSSFCGEDIDNYPVDEINRIFEATEALRASAETFDRFFRAGAPINQDTDSDGAHPRKIEDKNLELACASRTELIPRFARAKNIKGKWKYLLQASDGNVQNYQITVCSTPGGVCVNDLDSPAGEGRTICRQIFKTEKLLALDESGDVVVDTFLLPSACVCHFRESPLAEISTRLAANSEVLAKTNSAASAEAREASDKQADDPRCEETENSLDSIISSARSRSAFSSFRFPGATSDDDRDKRRTGAGGDSGPVVGPRSGVIDPDRVYFGPRKTAAVSRTLRGQGLQALFEGRRRRRRQVEFHKSKPLEPSTEVHSISVRSNELPAENPEAMERQCDDEICRTNDPDYPLTMIQQGLTRHGTLDDKKAFSSLFGPSCGNSTVNIKLRQSFDLKESPLCKAYQKYIFPQKALTVRGEYRYIINTGDYKQGVTVETCTRRAKGRGCKYAGRDGRYPSATVCKQMYALQNMLAINEEGNVYVETFRIPSACVCELIDKDPFQKR